MLRRLTRLPVVLCPQPVEGPIGEKGCLNLDLPFRAGVASCRARQAAPRPGGPRFFSAGRPHPDAAHVLTTLAGAPRSRETVDPG